MRKLEFTESQKVAVLKERESGVPLIDSCRMHGISMSTYYYWKKKYLTVQTSERPRSSRMPTWIEGVKRGPDGFLLEMISPDGRWNESMANLPRSLSLGRSRLTNLTTDLTLWTNGDARPFWSAMDIEGLGPKDRNSIFQYSTSFRTYLIPASVFLMGLYRRMFGTIHDLVFKPQGLDSLCSLIPGSITSDVAFFSLKASSLRTRNLDSMRIHQVLSWALCFPSGRMLWDSLYQSALQNRFDLSLPKARIRAECKYVEFRGFCLVTSLAITQLEALENPFSFAQNHPRQINSKMVPIAAENTSKKPYTSHQVISPRGTEWKLLDEEWAAIKPLLSPLSHRSRPWREIIDAGILKYGTGCTWEALRASDPAGKTHFHSYYALRRTEIWELIVEKLNELRARVFPANTPLYSSLA